MLNVLIVLIATACFAQPAADWQARLESLAAAVPTQDPAALAPAFTALRRAISTQMELPEPAPLATRDALLAEAALLRTALENHRRDGGVFSLARVEVNVTAELPQISTATTLEESEYRQRNLQTLPDALNLVSGVTVQRIGPRNERGVFIRGFDVRQVPLYIDGIPVYVPYDGYVDMDRFLTFDVAEIEISKGFTSPLYGPNALGGAINLITKAPSQPLTLDLGTGLGSGLQRNAFANAGFRWRNYWAQTGFAWLSSETFPLPASFRPVGRDNAYQRDAKGRLRLGWTPNSRDQYTFTYARQSGEKGNPPYAGNDPIVRPRFWQWPQWDKESFYFVGNKSLGETTYVRARFYYDRFDNLLKSYDDPCYCTQTRPSSFTSPFDDDTHGLSVELGGRVGSRQTVKSSVYFKDDTHREGNLGTPLRSFRDQSFSLGIEDTVRFNDQASAIFGFSADQLRVLNAENFVSGAILPFPKFDLWAFNPQAGFFYQLAPASRLHFTFARKTRLPTIKDRYSYRLGQAIPNPELREERTNNWEIGATHLLGHRTFLETSLFRSDVSNSTQRFFVQPNIFQLRNLGEARYLGAEFTLRTSLGSRLNFQSNYTHLSRRNLSNPGLLLVDAPRHKVFAAATYRLTERVNVIADFRYEGGRWFQNDGGNFGRATNHAVSGLGAAARLAKGLDLQAGLNNGFDRLYVLVDGYPEPGRNFYLNLRYRF